MIEKPGNRHHEEPARLQIATILILSVCLLCGYNRVHATSLHPVTGEPLPDNQTFTYRLLDEIPTFDPQLNQDSAGFDVLRDLFEGLLTQNAEGKLAPGVAEQFIGSDLNRTWTFHLRENAKWSNGDPVTAADFVYAWQRAVDPATASPYAWYVELSAIVNAAAIIAGEKPPSELGVKALDDHTLQVRLEKSLPYFPAMTTYATFFPVHRATIETHGAGWTRPGKLVSNGAYILTEHVPNEYHSRARNPMYWNNQATLIEQVTGQVINDENQALTRYLAGELDRTAVPAGQYPNLKQQYPDEATSTPLLCTYYYIINHTDSANPALADVRVRKALSWALDRNILVHSVLKGGQYPAYNFTHRATAGFETPVIAYATLTQAQRDEQARKLITEAGYGADTPLKLKLIYNTSESHKQLATVAAQMWKQKLGIEIELINYEWKTYLSIRDNQQFDLARAGWCGDYNEASTFLDLLTSDSGANDGRYINAQVDSLMQESRTLTDPGPNYYRVETIIAEDMAIIPIYHYTSVFMLKPDIRGWPYDNVQQNWYSKDLWRSAN